MGKTENQNHQKQTIVELQKQIGKLERASSPHAPSLRSAGALDDLFPDQGVRGGTLVEWLGDEIASGAVTLSLTVGRQVCPKGSPVILIDTRHQLFPVSLAAFGFELSRIVMVHPASEQEALWACEEALRCTGIGLVWANIERLGSISFRRLQLAAKASHGIGFLLRSAKARHQPSWADVRLLVHSRPSYQASPRLHVEVASSQGKPCRSMMDILLYSSQGTIHAVSSTNPANPLSVVS